MFFSWQSNIYLCRLSFSIYDFVNMINLLLKWVVTALSLMLVSSFLPGFVIASFYTALILAVVLGVLNLIVKPVLFVLTLPINFLTLGLFTLVINGGLIWFANTFVKGFETDFVTAVFAAVILWVISWITNIIFK